ncbi:MAG: Bug family tripartite tricarboxylate transporter substrate binding protein [Pigmentiphaga sp.]
MTPTPRKTRRRFVQVTASLALAFGAVAAGPAAHAQPENWPDKPIRFIVNFPPGGVADVIARLVAEPVGKALGQTVVVENRAGAGGNIGAEATARSAPDGYTFLVSSGGVPAINPHLYSNLTYDPNKDLVPVAALASVPVFLVTRLELPDTLQGFIDYAKANPGKLSYPSPGNGSSPHIAGEMFSGATGVEALHVPYRGAAPAVVDLLAGQVDFFFDPGVALPHVKEGKLRVLAVGSPSRSPLLPDVPTLDEMGVKDFDADTLFGMYAPAGTDPAIIERMNAEVNTALEQTNVMERIASLGAGASPMTPQAFQERIKVDFDRNGEVIRDRKIAVQ